MSKKFSDAMESLALSLEAGAAAARAAGAAAGVSDAKSGDSAADAVAPKSAGSKGKAAAATEAVAAKPAKAAKAKAAAITFEVLKAKLTDLVNSKGKEVAKEILSSFGAAKLVDLEEDEYQNAYNSAVEALNAEEETETTEEADDMFGE